MKNYIYLTFCFLLFSCNNNNGKVDLDYVKALEKKNKALEEEVKELKGESKRSNACFFIGSTMDEVISVMGEPSSFLVTAPEARRFYYGLSSVYFYQGKVIAYDNIEGNLQVRVKK